MFNIDARQMEKMMKQMGINSEEIDAEEVIIKSSGKEIIIKHPSVTKVDMKGIVSFQISGKVEERVAINDEDLQMIMDQTGCSKETAKKVLEETGDIAEAILKLKK